MVVPLTAPLSVGDPRSYNRMGPGLSWYRCTYIYIYIAPGVGHWLDWLEILDLRVRMVFESSPTGAGICSKVAPKGWGKEQQQSDN